MASKRKPPGRKRRRARAVVLSSLYAYHTTGQDPHDVFTGICEKDNLTGDPAQFAQRLFAAAVDHAADIDQMIRQTAANWSFDRIAFVDKNVLRLGIAELVYLRETPPKTAINEAIELAREYSSEDSSKFVNGILDAIYHQHMNLS